MASPSTHAPPLERGKACLRCRIRKMRCDGVRPMCNQCTRGNQVECEYTDGGETPSQALQRRVDYLQAQIHTLEGQSNQTITLHHPYGEPSGGPSRRDGQHESEGQGSTALLQAFFSQAKNCGFFLNTRQFMERLNPRASGAAPLPAALIYAAQLVGTLFIQDARLKGMADQILTRASQHLSSTQEDPGNVTYLIQTEVLLAYYHFYQNQPVQGIARMSGAGSKAIGWGLHTSNRGRGPNTAGVLGRYHLPAPIDTIEAGERVNAFWTVFCMERCWAVTQKVPSMFDEVSVPWPLNMPDYEQGEVAHFPAGATSTMTVRVFLENHAGHESDRGLLAMLAKASILFERSADLVRNWAPNALGFQQKVVALGHLIEEYKRALPSVPARDSPHHREGSPTDLTIRTRSLLLIHTLVQCAILNIYQPRQERDPSKSRALQAACTASGLLQRVDVRALGYVDPFMGFLWSSIIDVLIDWHRRVSPSSAAGASSSAQRALPPHPVEGNITTSLDCLFAALGALAPRNPWIDQELYKKLQQYRAMPRA